VEAFDKEYEKFMEGQIAKSEGERRRRLTGVERLAETLFLRNVWWPMFGSFDRLHAEWEVPDIRKGYRYLDFAYLLPPLRIALEIEGFGPHAKHADRRKFADDHLRAAYLQAEGWKVLRFSYDTVKDEPQVCRQILTMLIGKWSHAGSENRIALTDREKAVIRIAIAKQEPVTPADLSENMQVSAHTARRWLHEMTEKGVFRVASGVSRARTYALRAEQERLFHGMQE